MTMGPLHDYANEAARATVLSTMEHVPHIFSDAAADDFPPASSDTATGLATGATSLLTVDAPPHLRRALSDENESSSDTTDGPLDVAAEVTSFILLFFLIFGMSATVDMRNLVHQLHNKFAILTGVAMQFLIMPFLGFVAVMSLKDSGLTSAMGITLLIVTSSPGGSYSNWWCSVFNADLALSVAMTALSTLLSTFLLPANLMLYAHAAYGFGQSDDSDDTDEDILKNINWGTLFISISVVIVAIITGLYASWKVHSRKFQRWANRFGSLSGILLIVFSAAFSSGSGDSETALWGQDWSFYVGVSLPCLVGLFLANVFARLARLNKPEVVTVSIECCYQNVGIATSAAVSMFDDKTQRAQALTVPLFYGLLEAVVLGIYCLVAWKVGWTKAPSDEKFCTVLGHTYEVSDDDDDDDDDTEAARYQEEGENVEGMNATTPRTVAMASQHSVDTWGDNGSNSCSPRSRRFFGWFRRRRNEPEDQGGGGDADSSHSRAADLEEGADKLTPMKSTVKGGGKGKSNKDQPHQDSSSCCNGGRARLDTADTVITSASSNTMGSNGNIADDRGQQLSAE